MDAIHRARVDGFLDAVSRIAILANRSGTTEIGLHHERVGGHMGAVTTTDAGGFIHPHGFLSQGTAQNRLTAGSFNELSGESLKSKNWVQKLIVGQSQASQRVTTSSMEPSWVTRCSDT